MSQGWHLIHIHIVRKASMKYFLKSNLVSKCFSSSNLQFTVKFVLILWL